jgi:heme-degrading monooxygenase HmoA
MYEAIAYAQVVDTVIPKEAWDEAYFSLLSLKSHIQSLPGWQRFDFWARDLEEGGMKVVVVTNWEHPEQLERWLQSGITADAVLRSIKPAPESVHVELFEEIA